jgi:hypothetical protein
MPCLTLDLHQPEAREEGLQLTISHTGFAGLIKTRDLCIGPYMPTGYNADHPHAVLERRERPMRKMLPETAVIRIVGSQQGVFLRDPALIPYR